LAHPQWYDLSEQERYRPVRAEIDALQRMIDAGDDLHDALRVWCDEADAAGWTQLYATVNEQGYASFCRSLALYRERAQHERGANDAFARAWRAAHREWRPDMTPDDLDRWEEAQTGGVVRFCLDMLEILHEYDVASKRSAAR
jgi:hypothetical protein